MKIDYCIELIDPSGNVIYSETIRLMSLSSAIAHGFRVASDRINMPIDLTFGVRIRFWTDTTPFVVELDIKKKSWGEPYPASLPA